MLNLIRPVPEFLESYRLACAETFGHVHDAYIIHDPAKFDEWKKTIFRQFEREERGIGLPDGYVPSVTFWLVDGAEYAGTVNIRLRLNARLADYGGNLGFMLRLSRRGQGLSREICRLGIAQARELGVEPVLLTCRESNLPSLRCLLKQPYKRMERAEAEVDGICCPVRRFYM